MEWVHTDGGRGAAGYQGFTSDCVVRAWAIVRERPYQEVYDDLQAMVKAKTPSESIRDGCPKEITRAYAVKHGWLWTPTMKIGSGCKVHLVADELPKGRVVVSVSKHVVAVIDGVIHDNHDPARDGTRCVYGHWTPRSST